MLQRKNGIFEIEIKKFCFLLLSAPTSKQTEPQELVTKSRYLKLATHESSCENPEENECK